MKFFDWLFGRRPRPTPPPAPPVRRWTLDDRRPRGGSARYNSSDDIAQAATFVALDSMSAPSSDNSCDSGSGSSNSCGGASSSCGGGGGCD